MWNRREGSVEDLRVVINETILRLRHQSKVTHIWRGLECVEVVGVVLRK